MSVCVVSFKQVKNREKRVIVNGAGISGVELGNILGGSYSGKVREIIYAGGFIHAGTQIFLPAFRSTVQPVVHRLDLPSLLRTQPLSLEGISYNLCQT
jgi:hypothetical protein